MFLHWRARIIKWNVLAKDNESEIKPLNNGCESCTWNSKHIAIKYFWVTDRIKDGKIIVEHCPTDQINADYMSKPIQGSLFKTFCEALMGWTHVSKLYKGNIRPKERFEGNKKLSPSSSSLSLLKLSPGSPLLSS